MQRTKLQHALASEDLDEFITRVTDSTGTQIDPLNQDALQTVAADELRSRLHDSTGTQIDPAKDGTLSSELSREIATWSAGVLSIQEDTPLDVSAAEVDVDLNSQTLGAVTVTDDGALDINTLPNVTVGSWSAGTLLVQEDTALDVSATTVPTEQQTPVGVEDSAGTQVDPARKATHDTVYTSIDLNTAATTTVYDPTTEAEVDGIHLNHGGSTAELRLEVTDGTNTAVIQDAAAGDPIHYPEPLHLNSDDSLQVVVEVVEGASLTETAAVSRSEL